MAHRGQVAIP